MRTETLASLLTRLLLCAPLFLISYASSAADGAFEINQVCAEETGCFPGDAPGFPVTITEPSSYILTGRLDLTGLPSTTAVVITSPAVHLDLGGFEIVGPTNCTGSGSTISCFPIASAHGVEIYSNSIASSLRNGTIRGFNNGISASPEGFRISDLTTMNNSNDGVSSGKSAMINNSVSMLNGGDGFDGDNGSVFHGLMAYGNGLNGIEIDNVGGVVSGSTSRTNGDRGFNVAANSKYGSDNSSWGNASDDNCGGGICTDKRRYYLTISAEFDGTEASDPTTCAVGFHMASAYELYDLASLQYDGVLGAAYQDSGTGPPPISPGWVRGGTFTNVNFNCGNWDTASPTAFGPALSLNELFSVDTAINERDPLTSIWSVRKFDCSNDLRVWCIED